MAKRPVSRRVVKRESPKPSHANATAIGYCKPPKQNQFKPGKSGNPKGRPKNSRNLKTIIQQALTSTVTVREGGSTRRVSKLEGIVLRQIETALKGNEKAALAVLRMAGQVDLLNGNDATGDGIALTASEQRMLSTLLQGSNGPTIKT